MASKSGFSSIARIALGLACLSASVLLAAQAVGLVPDRREAVLEGRRVLCENVAVNCSLHALDHDMPSLRASLVALAKRNPEVVSAGVRLVDGRLIVDIGAHQQVWSRRKSKRAVGSFIEVPITAGNKPWGTVELQFLPLNRSGFWAWFDEPVVRLVTFCASASYLIYFFYLQKMLQHLDPSKVVPDRVRSALDTLSEGLLVLDNQERIVLANEAFARTVSQTPQELQGRRASELPWIGDAEDCPLTFPWLQSIEGEAQSGVVLGLRSGPEQRKFRVNSSPIMGTDGQYRGALASFDDVTQFERNRSELREMLRVLEESRDQISRQNRELQVLATLDPLTSCLNRRAFFSAFESAWQAARKHNQPLSAIMLDVDHFKALNDRFGHAAGDQVLERMGRLLQEQRREGDLVCRYGGEEFSLLLPQTDLHQAAEFADTIRAAIAAEELGELSITVSVGVSADGFGAHDPQSLLDQADQCLYMAKHTGRNRVVRRDQMPADVEMQRSGWAEVQPAAGSVPFQAVTALVSALAYRDVGTAEHSRRVADLCVAAANGLMSVSDSYLLEIGALLHDIGKIGVPDAVLLKPGPLTAEEWEMMRVHDRVGVEIVRSTFANEKLARIVQTHHAWYDQEAPENEVHVPGELLLEARLLTIADAYDAMVSDRVYRKGRSQEEAFAELRRFAGKQFDPELVERFIETVQARDENRLAALPPIGKQTALQIGMEIERLAAALDEQDVLGLTALAGRLKTTASKHGIQPIADVAQQLQEAACGEGDLKQLIQCTSELLQLCRSTQRVYLKDCDLEEAWS